jgi:HlyD family secretion protein
MSILLTAARQVLGAAAVVAATASCAGAPAPDAYGNIEATEVVVGGQATGQLLAYTPAEGDRAAAGAVVAVVDTSGLVLQLDQLAAERAASVSHVNGVARQIDVLEAQRAIAEHDYERTKRLAAQQAATAQQLDQSERDYRTLLAQIDATRAQRQTASAEVASAAARVAQLRDQIRKSSVVNPVSGTILVTYAKAGEVVQAGQPLYKIANLDTMELRAYVTEPQLAQVRVGGPATVSVDAGGAGRRTLTGVVDWVSSEAEFTPTPIETRDQRSNLVYAVKIRLPNRDGALKIGMPADVTLAPRAVASTR